MAEQGVNQRVMLTKQLIHDALLEMLEKCNINKISIRELCSIAGINRTTFYNHYGSQYDVLTEITQEYLQNTSFCVINDIAKGKNFMECLVHVLKYVKANLAFAKLVLKQDNYELTAYVTESMPQFDQMIVEHLPDKMDLDEKKAIALYVQYGTVMLLKEWILSNCRKKPEEEATLILRIIARTMGN